MTETEIKELNKKFSDKIENDKIIDTHLGSGSIAIAIDKANTLDKMNLSFTGIELDEDYFDKSVERIKVFKMQKTLF